jgi:hypothetical protein
MGEFRRQCGRWVRSGNTRGTRHLLPGRKSLATGGAISEGSRVPMANPKQTEVQPHSVADDFGCKPVTGVEINLLVHPRNLPDFSLLGNLTIPSRRALS